MRDEHTIARGARVVGFLGARSSVFTFAWLASHRDRLRTAILGGKRLSVLVVWDSKGAASVNQTDADRAAIKQLTYGRNA